MKNLRNHKRFQSLKTQLSKDKGNEFSKSVHNWLAQYDEEYDFLCGKVSSPLLEFKEED